MTDARFIYVTAASRDEALRIGRALVEERLAACANLIEPATSIYWWDGKVQSETEVILVMKSRADLVERLTARVKALHSYAVPCIVALPIEAGNPDYLRWIASETRGS
jgi:periplasmic divalent cation tolerance protein